MSGSVVLGSGVLSVEDVVLVARERVRVELSAAARERMARGRQRLEELIARGERIYGVNTGIGGNVGIALAPEQMELLQANLVRQLGCATGAPLPGAVVRAAMLLRAATFATGASAVRMELTERLVELLNAGIVPVVPRYGSVGASGDLMPSAYVARALAGEGEVEYGGRRMAAAEALREAHITPLRFAPKEALALINGTTFMSACAALVWQEAGRVLRALVGAAALAVEGLQAPAEPFAERVQEMKGHPGQSAVAAYLRELLAGSRLTREGSGQACYSLRCVPQGLGPAWEGLESARATIERELNSANDNPLVDPDTGALYRAGNFYGGHMARLLDTLKIDFAVMGNWAHALLAVLVDTRFNGGLPANLVPGAGVNSGFKGVQLSVTALACAVRQMAGPSSIHSLPTEQYNQDVVSLGMHAAVTAMDALECLRNAVAMTLMAGAQAVDLRGGPAVCGKGTRELYGRIRQAARFLDADRPMEEEAAAVAALIRAGEL